MVNEIAFFQHFLHFSSTITTYKNYEISEHTCPGTYNTLNPEFITIQKKI